MPHQANLRIIESVAKYAGVPMEKVMVTVHKYGNMSAATVPVALVEALEEGRVKPGSLILMPGVRRRTHVSARCSCGGASASRHSARPTRALPPCTQTALEMVNEVRAHQDPNGQSRAGLMAPVFVETTV